MSAGGLQAVLGPPPTNSLVNRSVGAAREFGNRRETISSLLTKREIFPQFDAKTKFLPGLVSGFGQHPPRHSDYGWLISSQFRMGRSFGATRIWMLLATPS